MKHSGCFGCCTVAYDKGIVCGSEAEIIPIDLMQVTLP